MGLLSAYLTGKHKEIGNYFDVILSAQAPEKFTTKFLKDLGFTSSMDTLFVNILKGIGFLDNAGTPTQRYFKFLDPEFSKKMVAEGIRDAYSDLFQLNKNANNLAEQDLIGKLKSITEGKKSDEVIKWMAKTFTNLCAYADFSIDDSKQKIIENKVETQAKNENAELEKNVNFSKKSNNLDFNYDIHIHLPVTRDISVYDALFESLKKHLLWGNYERFIF